MMLSTSTLLTALLLALQAPVKDEEPNPEPPPPAPVSARLVAKKKTYKLDLGGMTAAKFRDTVKAGGANMPQAPTVDMALVIKNNTKNTIRIRTTGSTSRVSINLSGPNVVEGSVVEPRVRLPIGYVVLKPGEKTEIRIDRLQTKVSTLRHTRHYWAEPGEYTLSASFYTYVQMNYNPQFGGAAGYQTLKSGSIKVKVEK
jgi:hypothetical protein